MSTLYRHFLKWCHSTRVFRMLYKMVIGFDHDGHQDNEQKDCPAGEHMARRSAAVGNDGLVWINALAGHHRSFVWDDGVHLIARVDLVPEGLAYSMYCGQMFTFAVAGFPILEADIPLPGVTCETCLSQAAPVS